MVVVEMVVEEEDYKLLVELVMRLIWEAVSMRGFISSGICV